MRLDAIKKKYMRPESTGFGMRAGLRRALMLALICLPTLSRAFSLDDVAVRAQELAGKPYDAPKPALPKTLDALDYSQYNDIQFRADHAIWHKLWLPFELQLFHAGYQYKQPVRIHLVDARSVRTLAYDPADFDFGRNTLDVQSFGDIGFAGFRAHYALNGRSSKDEVAVFLGASFFRALGKGQRYGLSARGLAIDTAEMTGEEYSRFTDFWIEQPGVKAHELVIYALLDSRRVAGAYRFVLHPGSETWLDVQAQLYPRAKLAKLGIAPLSSMYFRGENQFETNDDYRPELHDSDGLSLHTAQGEWLWRPLANPKRLQVSRFTLENPAGFGLMQRDRDFRDYQDLDARYDRRPSAWVTPKGDWGRGRVELVQIPTPDETHDNIVAYWVPEQPVEPGKSVSLQYRLSWQRDKLSLPKDAWVSQTRRGQGLTPAEPETTQYQIDFEGPALRKLKPGVLPEASVSGDENVELLSQRVIRNDVTNGYRLVLRVRRKDEDAPAELRATLRVNGKPVSETWNYLVPAER